jgi:hypothetical protein
VRALVSSTLAAVAIFTAASAASAQTGPTGGVQGAKIVTGDTAGWTRDIVINLSCPAAGVDRDFHVPPDLPGNYQLGVTDLATPSSCTVEETDRGTDGLVSTTTIVVRSGVAIASGETSADFVVGVGDHVGFIVTNDFGFTPGIAPPEQPATTATTAPSGGSTTTTVASTTTTAPPVVPTLPAVPETPPSTAPPTTAATTTVPGLPTTGRDTEPLVVAALVAMIAGLTLVARARRFVD